MLPWECKGRTTHGESCTTSQEGHQLFLLVIEAFQGLWRVEAPPGEGDNTPCER